MERTLALLDAGAVVAAGRSGGLGVRAVRSGPRVASGPGHRDRLAVHDGVVTRAGRGLPLALGRRRLWRLGYRRGAWMAGVALGTVTTAASVLTGLIGPIAIALCAAVLRAPVWAAWLWLRRRR